MRLFRWGRPSCAELIQSWPALEGRAHPAQPGAQSAAKQSADDDACLAALSEMRARQDAHVARHDLIAAEPLLRALVLDGSPRVRCAALETWATILEGRVTRAHVDVLFDLSSEPDLDPALLDSAIRAALTFGDDGDMAAALVAQSATRRNQALR
jgi:hypothetical protein